MVLSLIMEKTKKPLEAVDEALKFMRESKGWGKAPERIGNVMYITKSPRNPEGLKAAKTKSEKVAAYCFCAILRENYNEGMNEDFCNCSSGWFRAQWEGVFGKPVKVDILKSILKDDEECKFAIHIPKDL